MEKLTVSHTKTHFNHYVRQVAAYDDILRVENQRTQDTVIILSERAWLAACDKIAPAA